MKHEEDSGYEKALLVALRSLRQADRLRAEVERALLDKGFTAATVEAVLNRLETWRFLDDRRTVDERVTQLRRRHHGRARIAAALLERGAPEDAVLRELAALDDETEVESALGLLARRHDDTPARAGRYLAGRGFDEDTIRAALERRFPEAMA